MEVACTVRLASASAMRQCRLGQGDFSVGDRGEFAFEEEVKRVFHKYEPAG